MKVIKFVIGKIAFFLGFCKGYIDGVKDSYNLKDEELEENTNGHGIRGMKWGVSNEE